MGTRTRHPFPLHTLAAAFFPLLSLFTRNLGELTFRDMLPLTGASLSLLATTLAFSHLVFRNPTRANLGATWFLLLFYSYGHARRLVLMLPFVPSDGRVGQVMLPLWCALLVLGFLGIRRSRLNGRHLAAPLNLSGAALLVFPVLLSAGILLRREPSSADIARPRPATIPIDSVAPDIYYIILDTYAGPRTLKEFLGFDNSAFLEYLRQSGFFVAEQSRANYLRTYQSLASSLNMRHHDRLIARLGPSNPDRLAMYESLRAHEVGRYLSARGYRYIHLGSWWHGSSTNPLAHTNLYPSFTQCRYGPLPMNELSMVFIRTTLLYPFLARFSTADHRTHHRLVALEQKKWLMRVAHERGPKFVFAHILLPHPPFVFAADGGPVAGEADGLTERKRRYIDQLQFTNTMIREVLDHLRASSIRPPIIVLQADEGTTLIDSALPPAVILAVRARILNAYHLPGVAASAYPPPHITPVNTFPYLFNTYFGDTLPYAANTTHAMMNECRPNDLTDITALLDSVDAEGSAQSYDNPTH